MIVNKTSREKRHLHASWDYCGRIVLIRLAKFFDNLVFSMCRKEHFDTYKWCPTRVMFDRLKHVLKLKLPKC